MNIHEILFDLEELPRVQLHRHDPDSDHVRQLEASRPVAFDWSDVEGSEDSPIVVDVATEIGLGSLPPVSRARHRPQRRHSAESLMAEPPTWRAEERAEAPVATSDVVPIDTARRAKALRWTLMPVAAASIIAVLTIVAINRPSGQSGPADAGSGTTTSSTDPNARVPDPPYALVVSSGGTGIFLRWSAPADDGGARITGYTVRASDGLSFPVSGFETTFFGPIEHNGTSDISFTVVATNAIGNSEPSTPVVLNATANTTVPIASPPIVPTVPTTAPVTTPPVTPAATAPPPLPPSTTAPPITASPATMAAPRPVISGITGNSSGTTATWNSMEGTTTCQDRETWTFTGPVPYPTRDSGWGYHCWPTHSTTPVILTPGTWTATLTIYLNGQTASASATVVVTG